MTRTTSSIKNIKLRPQSGRPLTGDHGGVPVNVIQCNGRPVYGVYTLHSPYIDFMMSSVQYLSYAT